MAAAAVRALTSLSIPCPSSPEKWVDGSRSHGPVHLLDPRKRTRRQRSLWRAIPTCRQRAWTSYPRRMAPWFGQAVGESRSLRIERAISTHYEALTLVWENPSFASIGFIPVIGSVATEGGRDLGQARIPPAPLLAICCRQPTMSWPTNRQRHLGSMRVAQPDSTRRVRGGCWPSWRPLGPTDPTRRPARVGAVGGPSWGLA